MRAKPSQRKDARHPRGGWPSVFPSAAAVVSLLVLGLLAGCQEGESIRRYTVERPVPPHRMLAAVLPHEQQAWFFKLTGPNEMVAERENDFVAFLRSVRFEDGKPAWQLPDRWESRPGTGMRFATIVIDPDGAKLELSVTALPKLGDDEQVLLSNINRWRGQLGLGNLVASQLPSESTRVAIDDPSGIEATVVNMVGRMSGGSMGAAPFAGGASPPPPAPAAEVEIEYEAPESWQPGQRVVTRSGIRIERAAAFQFADGKGEVTITQLPASPGARLPNINRWRRQVGLPPTTEEELANEMQEIPVGDGQGSYVRLIGPELAILGVMAVRGRTAWFVKLTGPHDRVIEEQARFEQFVASLRFPE